jgi:uncharacterized membrane protein YhhN
MNEAGVLLQILFAVCSALYLAAALSGCERARRALKVCLLPLLFGFYAVSAARFLPTVLLAGLAGWTGDIILIGTGPRRKLTAGIAAFLLGHVFYIISIASFLGGFDWGVLVLAALAVAPVMAVIFLLVRPEKRMVIPVVAYEAVIAAMAVCAFLLLVSRRDTPSALVFAGSLLFIASDVLLAYSVFRAPLGNAAVMLPYIAAQYCIVSGLAAN